MPSETYPCYVRIGESVGSEDFVELPTETDGTMLLSTIAAQYPDAIGLRFKSESGAWRGVRVTDGVLDAPLEGWGYCEYYITLAKKAGKRKLEENGGPGNKKKTEQEMLSDLIVLGLPYSATEDDVKTYFEKYGKLAHYEVKFDSQTQKSRGFGFIRFTSVDAVETVLAESHTIGGRKCEVRFPKEDMQDDGVPTKLFIGRLPRGTTTDDLRECFSDYGRLRDVYIPTNFRGFGFVTFGSQEAAQEVLNSTHVIKGSYVNVTHPTPKAGEQNPQNMQMQQQQQQQYGYGMQGNMQGNMPGNMQGNMPGNMQGNMPGNMQGNMQGGNMQGNMPGNMQGNMRMPPPQQGGGYGNQQGNKMNSGYYTSGYFQPAGKVQGGKTM